MKYIITYTAKRKNAKRHVLMSFGRRRIFNTLEAAEQILKLYSGNEHYVYEICTANFKPIKKGE